VALQDAGQHAWIRLAQHGFGRDPRGRFQARAYGAAIDQQRGTIGGADTVGMGGDKGKAAPDPEGGARKALVGEHIVEPDHDGFRVVIDNLESAVDDFARQTFSAQHEEPSYPRVLFPQVVERRRGRGDNALGRNSNAHAFQMLDVIPSAPRRVVGQKGVADADPLEPAEKRKRPVKQGAPAIERAVHVQRNMLDVPQSRGQ